MMPSLEAFKTGHPESDLMGPDMWRTSLRAFRWILKRDRGCWDLGSFTWFTNGLLTGSVFLSVCWQAGFRCKRRCLGILGCIYSLWATNRGSSWSVPDMDGVIWRLGAGLCVQKEEQLRTFCLNFMILRYFWKSLNDSERQKDLVGVNDLRDSDINWGFGYRFHQIRSYHHMFQFFIEVAKAFRQGKVATKEDSILP